MNIYIIQISLFKIFKLYISELKVISDDDSVNISYVIIHYKSLHDIHVMPHATCHADLYL